jgi:glycosyltransferase involved in cell wall biosynthesis
MTDTTSMRVTAPSDVAETLVTNPAVGAVPEVSEPVAGAPRVVIATILPPEGTTGVQTHIREVRSYLSGTGRAVSVVHPRSPGTALAPALFAGRVPLSKLSNEIGVAWYREWHWRFLRRALRRELARGEAAVVYAQCPLAARAALDVRATPDQRVVMAVHFDGSQADEWVDKDLIRDGGRVYRRIRALERLTIPYVDGIVFMSASAQRSMRRYGLCLDARSSQVVPNFTVDPAAVAGEPVATDRADLVTLGGLEIHKNHEYMLRVLAVANRLGRRYTLDVIGEGPTRRPLARLSRELGLEGQVRLRGRIPSGRALLPGHRAYVHTATREVFPYALIEAMAAGLPVVAGRVGGISEMLEHHGEGVFWPLDDADAAARILVELLDDEPRRTALGAAARARFAGSFDARVLGPVLDEFLTTGRRHDVANGAHTNGGRTNGSHANGSHTNGASGPAEEPRS